MSSFLCQNWRGLCDLNLTSTGCTSAIVNYCCATGFYYGDPACQGRVNYAAQCPSCPDLLTIPCNVTEPLGVYVAGIFSFGWNSTALTFIDYNGAVRTGTPFCDGE